MAPRERRGGWRGLHHGDNHERFNLLNKKTKGLISAVAGASLLFGTAGTFALWYDQALFGATADAIQTGDLELRTVAGSRWEWSQVSNLVEGGPTVGSPYRGEATMIQVEGVDVTLPAQQIVPADELTYEIVLAADDAIHLVGDTLLANLILEDNRTGATLTLPDYLTATFTHNGAPVAENVPLEVEDGDSFAVTIAFTSDIVDNDTRATIASGAREQTFNVGQYLNGSRLVLRQVSTEANASNQGM